MKQVYFFLCAVGLCLGLAVNANALTITDVESAWEKSKWTWTHSYDTDDSERDVIQWGKGNSRSSLEFITGSQDISLDSAFSLGSLNHYNYPIAGDSVIPSPTLNLTFFVLDTSVSESVFDLSFELNFNIDETPNGDDPEESADHISWSMTDTTVEAEVEGLDGITYTYILEILGFGTSSDDTDSTSLTSYEGKMNSTQLWAQITKTSSSSPDTNPVPEPATMAMVGLGLLGLAGAAGRRKKK